MMTLDAASSAAFSSVLLSMRKLVANFLDLSRMLTTGSLVENDGERW
jgi:hypothetical protein